LPDFEDSIAPPTQPTAAPINTAGKVIGALTAAAIAATAPAPAVAHVPAIAISSFALFLLIVL
jgi:hypothetical protein